MGWGTCIWEVGWGVDGTGGAMSSGGGGLEMQTVLGEMLGKEGMEEALDHLPITLSGTEYHANKILSILAP